VTIGGCHAACTEAMDLLAKEGIAVDYMRVRGFPFGDDVARIPRGARDQFRGRAEP
jgi:2-oxoglutarate ferredoxin oxidoreductase subunit alpha